jgi:hypothetical protein
VGKENGVDQQDEPDKVHEDGDEQHRKRALRAVQNKMKWWAFTCCEFGRLFFTENPELKGGGGGGVVIVVSVAVTCESIVHRVRSRNIGKNNIVFR